MQGAQLFTSFWQKNKPSASILTLLSAIHATAMSPRRPFYVPCTHTHAVRTDQQAPYSLRQNYRGSICSLIVYRHQSVVSVVDACGTQSGTAYNEGKTFFFTNAACYLYLCARQAITREFHWGVKARRKMKLIPGMHKAEWLDRSFRDASASSNPPDSIIRWL